MGLAIRGHSCLSIRDAGGSGRPTEPTTQARELRREEKIYVYTGLLTAQHLRFVIVYAVLRPKFGSITSFARPSESFLVRHLLAQKKCTHQKQTILNIYKSKYIIDLKLGIFASKKEDEQTEKRMTASQLDM
jgi:hypothetical protein